MAKRNDYDELNQVVNSLMADPRAPVPTLSTDLTELLRIAADLRDLPSDDFKARLKAELLAPQQRSQRPGAGKVLRTVAEIEERLAELAAAPRMIAHDLRAALTDMPERSMRFLAQMDQWTLGVSRFSKLTHWERHPAADELLHILEGSVEITALQDEGPVTATAGAGSIFVCRQGLWHRLRATSPVSLFFATPGKGTEHSSVKDPRRRRGERVVPSGSPSAETSYQAHDIRGVLSRLPVLSITERTTGAQADAAFGEVTRFDHFRVTVGQFSGLTPWERHPGGDELLHILAGEVDVTVLTGGGAAHETVRAGSVFVCPRGLWHRQHATQGVTALYATPAPHGEISWADDPRRTS